MQRTSPLSPLASPLSRAALAALAGMVLCAVAGLAHARQTAGAAVSSAPPKLERIEEGSDTPLTVTPPKASARKVTEKRENGRVTEVEVQSGPSHYTMKPNVPAGNAVAGDGQSSAVRAPQWTVMEFDLTGKKKKTDKEAVDAAPAPPPPIK